MEDTKEISPVLFALKSAARNQEYIQSMCKNLLTLVLTLIGTFSHKQQKLAKIGGIENGVCYKHEECSVEPR